MDYLKTIKLGFGSGIPGEQACWMTALSAHIGGDWTDQCSCVDPSINSLCIQINDLYYADDQARTEDILEFGLFKPLGTKDEENKIKRKYFLIDQTIRFWTPCQLRAMGKIEEAKKLKGSSPIIDMKTATALFPFAVAKSGLFQWLSPLPAFVRRKFIKQYLFPTLRQLIDMGKHGPYEAEPVCGVEKFKELVGAK